MERQLLPKFLNAFFWQFLSPLIKQLRGFILIPIITKMVGIEYYSDWILFAVSADLVARFLNLNLGLSFQRFTSTKSDKDELSEDYSSILNASILYTIFVVTIILLLKEEIRSYIFDIEDGNYFLIMLLFFSSFRVFSLIHSSFLTSQRLFKFISILNISVNTFGLIAVGSVGYITKSLHLIIFTLVAVEVVRLSTYILKILFLVRYKFKINMNLLRRYLSYGIPLIFSSFCMWIVVFSDRYFILKIFDKTQNAIYSLNYTLSILLMLVSTVLDGIMLPHISVSFEKGDLDSVRRYIYISEQLIYYTLLPGAFGLFYLSDKLIRLISSPELISNSILLLPVLFLSALLFSLMTLYSSLLYLRLEISRINKLWGVIATINIILNIMLIQKIGIEGAAISTAISYAVGFGIIYSIVRVNYGVNIQIIKFIKSAIASFGMIGIIMQLNIESLSDIIFSVIIGIMAYCSFIVILDWKHLIPRLMKAWQYVKLSIFP